MSSRPVPASGSSDRSASSRSRCLFVALLLCATTFVTFGRTLRYDFLVPTDDQLHITANPRLLPPSLSGAAWFWSHPYGGMFIPVSYDYWMLEAALAGGSSGSSEDLDPRVFHLGSLALHASAALLVYLLLRRLLGADLPALVGALAFQLHPLQVESVAWISGTRGLLAAVLGLGALWVHLGGAGTARAVVSSVLLSLALLAKPSAVALPAIALALDVLVLRRSARASLISLTPWLVLVVVLSWVAKRLQSDAILDAVVAWWQRPRIAADALAFYLGKLVLPLDLVPDHTRTPARVLAASPLPAVAAAALSLVALGWRGAGTRWLHAAFGVFLLGLAPVLGLVPFSHQEISTVASRFAYLALLGPALGLARLAEVRAGSFRLVWAIVPVIVVWGVASFVQAGTWSDLRTTFERNLRLQPESAQSHGLMGRVLEREGELEAAYGHYLRALELGPDAHEAHLDLGNVRFRQGRLDEAAAHYSASIRASPGYLKAHRNRVRALTLLGRWAEAEPHLVFLLERAPGDAGLERQLARVRWWQGDLVAAAAGLERAAQRAPDDVDLILDRTWLQATAGAAELRAPDRALATAEALGLLDARREPARLWVLAAARVARGEPVLGLELARMAADGAQRSGRSVLARRVEEWIEDCESGVMAVDLPPLPGLPPGP